MTIHDKIYKVIMQSIIDSTVKISYRLFGTNTIPYGTFSILEVSIPSCVMPYFNPLLLTAKTVW